MSENKCDKFKYHCIHSTPKNGDIRYYYSNTNKNGHFGISKVIFGDGGYIVPKIDMDGKYAMTQHAMAIPVNTFQEANMVAKVIGSDYFNDIVKACMWSNFQIDWRMFKYFKQDFWKEFMGEDNDEI